MSEQLLLTKLYVPPPRPDMVPRPRLIERLNAGLHHKLTLISASAGFGKTTLVSEWLATCGRPVAWLSLDVGDGDPARFLAYFVVALQTLALSKSEGLKAKIGAGMLGALQNPQLPPIELLLTTLLNEITSIPENFILVLDDYHVVDSKHVDQAVEFLVEHLPPQMHLVIATREDPHLPLARLRTRGQLTELRAADLRFTPAETAEFLNQVMGINLSAEEVTALEHRTEGWIAGLQLAALSMQGHQDTAGFIKSFTGSHHFVLDYLIEEVLKHQSESIQSFLLRTSILDRLCGPLCDAVMSSSSASGKETLEYLQHANLFIVPLDNERRWYRYHHLFGDLLRHRLQQSITSENKEDDLSEYHIRASQWYEDNGLDLEAFQHAAAANDIERAARLMEGKGIPLHFHYAASIILDWLASLPKEIMDAKPFLWVKYASMALVTVQTAGVEERLQAAEAAIAAALQDAEPDEDDRNLIGQIATSRAMLALLQYRAGDIITQSRRAQAYLRSDNLGSLFTATWTMGVAYHLQGDRAAAAQAYGDALSICQMSGNKFHMALVSNSLGQIQEDENRLYQADESYRRVLKLFGDYPLPNASESYLGLARIYYEWNDLDAAQQYGQKALNLSRQYDRMIDRFIFSEVFLARLKLARGDVGGAAAMLAETEQSVRQQNFINRMTEVAAAQVLVLLRQGDLAKAAHLAQTHELPISQARVYLAQGEPSTALAVLEPLRNQMEAKGWADEQLKVIILQSVALFVHDEKDKAVLLLSDALALAQPGGFMRIFVDEGAPMAQLLLEAASQGVLAGYISKLLAAFEIEKQKSKTQPVLPAAQPLIEPLSQREIEVLQLIAQGLSNRKISDRLFLALSTVKGHNRIIFNKLQVQSRTEAVARARELDLLSSGR